MPAYNSQILQGDEIISINDIEILNTEQIINQISESKNVKLKINRNNEILEFNLDTIEQNYYYLGVINKVAENKFVNNVYYAYLETVKFVSDIFNNLKDLFIGNISVKQLSGPIGISEYIVKTDTVYNFVYMISLISLSLGITNLLPIPALDGGRIFLLIIEAIRRKPLEEELEMKIQTVGFLLIIGLSIYVSLNDILRIF